MTFSVPSSVPVRHCGYSMARTLFEIYSAGYTDGFNDEHNDVNDVVTSYDKFYRDFKPYLDNLMKGD